MVAVAAYAASAQQPVPRAPVIAEFGACVARQAPDRARELLRTGISTAEERKRAGGLAQSNYPCIRSRPGLSMRVGEIRGTVAEALLQADAAALERLRQMPAGASPRPAAARGRAFIHAFGTCVAQADPARAASIILTDVGSDAEVEAFRALGPVLDQCVPEGAPEQVGQFDLRNHIAAALYVLDHSMVEASASTR